MSMKVLRLYTHWQAEDAYSVLTFIDELREQIINEYGEEIVQMLQEARAVGEEQQLELPFADVAQF
ncbi:MAG: hypothetical protein U5S82_23980 [Gammaproteobacteria bacterium]|nr:hypothetical protein [Gammaproteobacteria bacterium]MDZ7751714.1 hypothetical protein [Gammaproteobacteria bacterium]MDZ7752528.1 hypothetical protein [Gammaproteobacteria bacterium]MDZ7752539.1 hypothetical protein [Gammaproteobacteria bacterium]MDZ7753284.1 hypothetical protein [Gammaproteobacteria bacterium]